MRCNIKMEEHIEFDKHANYEGYDYACTLNKGEDLLLITSVRFRPGDSATSANPVPECLFSM